MNPETLLEKVCRSLDILVALGAPYEGLFPSIIDRSTHQMMTKMPPGIAGQRDGDRSHLGSNLIHDQAALKTMYALAEALDRPDYAQAADRYLQRFATHCTNTITGIFPWGEHAYWHLVEDRVADSYQLREGASPSKTTHDHLRQVPLWLWEKLYAFNPPCVERFSEGINGHWTEGEPLEYIRHAYIDEKRPYARGARSCDFPRHGGFYIFDWAFAHLKTGRADFLQQIETMLDYWWEKRDDLGLLQTESRSPEDDVDFYRINAPGQTLSLGVSLLESAELIAGALPDLATRMRERAGVYIDGFLKAPHDLERGIYVNSFHRGSNEAKGTMPVWGSVYGNWPACYAALFALCGHRIRAHQELFEWTVAVGKSYLKTDFPDDIAVPAMDAGLGLELLADLYDLTGETRWLDGGMALAEKLMAIYMDGDLPRSASGIDWYESQMGPSFLLHGLARIALMARDGLPCILEGDYTAR